MSIRGNTSKAWRHQHLWQQEHSRQ
jgi:hypothetical protein